MATVLDDNLWYRVVDKCIDSGARLPVVQILALTLISCFTIDK